MPVITVQVQTLHPHVFFTGAELYSRPGISIGSVVAVESDE